MQTVARDRFAALMARPDDEIDLVEAALLIAAEDQAEVDLDRQIQRCSGQLAVLVDGARQRIDTTPGPARISSLLEYLAGDCRFRGNQEDYYDLRNSYLNEVLDRRIGIPITLAIVYMAIGRHLDLDIRGVGFPGHFLTMWEGPPRLLIDPFHGTLVDDAGCAERLRAVAGATARFDPAMLAVATTRQILARVLGNLKLIHFRSREFEAALSCSQRILLAQPDLPAELRDRAVLYLQLECFDAARRDFERFLEVAGDHEGAAAVRAQLENLRSHGPRVH